MSTMVGVVGSSIPRQKTIISSPVFGALVFVFVEIMFFSALMSSYFVIKRGREVWDIPGTVHLPVKAAGFNFGVLLLSGLFLFLARRAAEKENIDDVRNQVMRSIVLGGLFLGYQAYLGLGLVNAGLTMKSSIFGGCYFLIVGAHCLQVALGIVALTKFYLTLNKGIDRSVLKAVQIFWLFVVAIWPVLYAQIYL